MLHEDGNIPLAQTQAELTPIQRFVYIMAKDEATPDDMKEPNGMGQGTEVIKGWR